MRVRVCMFLFMLLLVCIYVFMWVDGGGAWVVWVGVVVGGVGTCSKVGTWVRVCVRVMRSVKLIYHNYGEKQDCVSATILVHKWRMSVWFGRVSLSRVCVFVTQPIIA